MDCHDILAAELFYREAIRDCEISERWQRLAQPIATFKLKVLQATNSRHSPLAEPSCRRRLAVDEFRGRVTLAAQFVLLRICWEEEWERLRFTTMEAFIQNKYLKNVHTLWIEEAEAWEDIILAAEPFKEMMAEVSAERAKAETVKRNKLLWLNALREREMERRRELEYHRDEFVLLEKLEASQRLLRTQEKYLTLAMNSTNDNKGLALIADDWELRTRGSSEELSSFRDVNIAYQKLRSFDSFLTGAEDRLWKEADGSFISNLAGRPAAMSQSPTLSVEPFPKPRPLSPSSNFASSSPVKVVLTSLERNDNYLLFPSSSVPQRESSGQTLHVPLVRRDFSASPSPSRVPQRSPLLVPLRKISQSPNY